MNIKKWGRLVLAKREDGEPFIPPLWFSLTVVPAMSVVVFLDAKLTGYNGRYFAPNPPVAFQDIDWGELPGYFVATVVFWFGIMIPIYTFRRWVWCKQHPERMETPGTGDAAMDDDAAR